MRSLDKLKEHDALLIAYRGIPINPLGQYDNPTVPIANYSECALHINAERRQAVTPIGRHPEYQSDQRSELHTYYGP